MFTDCPGVTAGGVQHLRRLSKLVYLWLYDLPAGVISATMLDNLHGCTGLQQLALGHPERPPETAIPAAAVSRSVSRHWPVCVMSVGPAGDTDTSTYPAQDHKVLRMVAT